MTRRQPNPRQPDRREPAIKAVRVCFCEAVDGSLPWLDNGVCVKCGYRRPGR